MFTNSHNVAILFGQNFATTRLVGCDYINSSMISSYWQQSINPLPATTSRAGIATGEDVHHQSKITFVMGPLDRIEFYMRDLSDMIREIKVRLERIENSQSENQHLELPEVYINTSEIQRFLGVSAPIINGLRKEGLITSHKNPKCPSNKFLLSEMYWLRDQTKLTYLSILEIRALIKKRKQELGY
jgi:hypothetical protein